MANQELLIFFVRLDLASRLQRTINNGDTVMEKHVRKKMAEVDQHVQKTEKVKQKSAGSAPPEQMNDSSERGLLVRAALQKAIDEEDYAAASRLRDELRRLESNNLVARMQMLSNRSRLFAFRLGQKVIHKKYAYRGVVCGFHSSCLESEGWVAENKVNELPRGTAQPFYQVIFETVIDSESQRKEFQVAYVAEDNLMLPEKPDMEAMAHPYAYRLFLGMDAEGNYLPCSQLRDKYRVERRISGSMPPPSDAGNKPTSQ
eukprot:jgi/Mesvir1/15522/Mv03174-RA.1